MVRRINIYGGPGIGKSTVAASLFAELKKKGANVELCPEHVKGWAYEGRKFTHHEQILGFANQMFMEATFLRNSDAMIISDSPPFLYACYTKRYCGSQYASPLFDLVRPYDREFPALQVMLERGSFPYQEVGRVHTEGQSKEMDSIIKHALAEAYEDNILYATPVNAVEVIVGKLYGVRKQFSLESKL